MAADDVAWQGDTHAERRASLGSEYMGSTGAGALPRESTDYSPQPPASWG